MPSPPPLPPPPSSSEPELASIFAGKVILITGAGSGVGRALAHHISTLLPPSQQPPPLSQQQPTHLILLDTDFTSLERTSRLCRSTSPTIKITLSDTDASSAQEVSTCLAEHAAARGIDYVITTPSPSPPSVASRAGLAGMTDAQFDDAVSEGLRGVFNVCRGFAGTSASRPGGGVVNVVKAVSGGVVDEACLWGVVGFSRGLGREVKGDGSGRGAGCVVFGGVDGVRGLEGVEGVRVVEGQGEGDVVRGVVEMLRSFQTGGSE